MLTTLVDCKPSEFLRQTSKIKKYAKEWLKITGIPEIRKRRPTLVVAPPNATKAERAEIIKLNAEKEKAQARENLSAIVDVLLDEHPDETLKMLALCCFIDNPEDVDKHTVSEYLEAANRLISDSAVLGFFISLGKLGQKTTPTA